MLTACVCGASPGAPPAHAGAPPAARRGRRAAARPPTRAWPAGGASGQADRGGWGRRFGWGGARPRQAPARALRSPGGALPWCCGCVRARARVLALSKLSTGEYDKLRRFSDRIRGDRRQVFPTAARGRYTASWSAVGRSQLARTLASIWGRRYWGGDGRIRSMDPVHAKLFGAWPRSSEQHCDVGASSGLPQCVVLVTEP